MRGELTIVESSVLYSGGQYIKMSLGICPSATGTSIQNSLVCRHWASREADRHLSVNFYNKNLQCLFIHEYLLATNV